MSGTMWSVQEGLYPLVQHIPCAAKYGADHAAIIIVIIVCFDCLVIVKTQRLCMRVKQLAN